LSEKPGGFFDSLSRSHRGGFCAACCLKTGSEAGNFG